MLTTVPIATPCYLTGGDSQSQCARLRDNYFFPETHVDHPFSVQAPFFMGRPGNTCNPFLSAPEAQCRLGNLVSLAVRARSAGDFEKTIAFANRHNLRLVVRNTGHDYQGRSTGAGAISVWTAGLRSQRIISSYRSKGYSGKAAKLGAGVRLSEAYAFASQNGVHIVGGNCPTVGIAGGYTQGGGHGPLASKHGLAADQTLEFEVVTADGRLKIASPEQNADLYWALSGGGGGTYGAVVSVTVKAHPATIVSAANLTFGMTADPNQFWDAVTTFQTILPGLADDAGTANYLVFSQGFSLSPVYLPGGTKVDVDAHLKPVTDALARLGIPHQYFSREFPDLAAAHSAMNQPFNVSQFQLGGRLVPRSVVTGSNAALVRAVRSVAEEGGLVSGVAQGVAGGARPGQNAVNPAWRGSLVSVTLGAPYSFADEGANVRFQETITGRWLPRFSALGGPVAAYGNEGDFRERDFKSVFYGPNYDRLDGIKRKYDPDDRFYGITNVGNDRWVQRDDLRLCRV